MNESTSTGLEAAPQTDCSQCGQIGVLLYTGLRDRHFNAPGEWSFLECARCGFCWLSPRPTAADLDVLYRDYYTHEETPTDSFLARAIREGIPVATLGYDDRPIDERVRRWGRVLAHVGPLRELGQRSIMNLPASVRGNLLDVGCGDGRFLRQMRDLGWRIAGVERDPRASEIARGRFGIDPVYADLTAARRAMPEGFDAITLSHVIEHFVDPLASLRECVAALRPGGRIVITTPNLRSSGHLHFGCNWLHLDPPRHIQIFHRESLRALAERSGLIVREIATPSSSAHFLWQASTLLAREGRLPGIRVEGISPWLVFRSLIFWAIEFTRTRLGVDCGEELLLVAERPATPIGEC